MMDTWAALFAGADTPEALAELTEAAQHEFDHTTRRLLAPDTTETWEELAARIVADGWGITADECARAMRCTPTMVRRARLSEMRHPDTGYALPAKMDAVAWARALDAAGLSVREIATVTGVAKSTLHDRLTGKTRRPRRDGSGRRAYA